MNKKIEHLMEQFSNKESECDNLTRELERVKDITHQDRLALE